MKNDYILEYINIKTQKGICYWVSDVYLTNDINRATRIALVGKLDQESLGMLIIERIYKKHEPGTMSEHTYAHIREDFFKDIPKHYVWYRIIDRTLELRKLKIKKLYDNTRIL